MVIERNFLGADAGIFRQNEVLMKKNPLKKETIFHKKTVKKHIFRV